MNRFVSYSLILSLLNELNCDTSSCVSMTFRSGLLTFQGSNATIRLDKDVFIFKKLFEDEFGSYEGHAVGIAEGTFGLNCGCITVLGMIC